MAELYVTSLIAKKILLCCDNSFDFIGKYYFGMHLSDFVVIF